MTATWRLTKSLSPEERLDVLHLMNRLETTLGREAIDEARRRVVVHGWSGEHWLCEDDGKLAQYALVMGDDEATLEMVGGGFNANLLAQVLTMHPVVQWWTRGPMNQALPSGEVVRMLQLLKVHLPVAVEAVPAGAVLRNFEPDRDADAWLVQNNAAFAHHPEQGAWSLHDLTERAREPWFDPSGFLVLELEGALAASCWTKVHELHPDRFGEIYVISVDPRFQGRGLGRVMVTQGLESLRRKGVADVVLFVDDSNQPAKKLYESLGFTLQREDHLVRFHA
ncbi:MAG TPA: mycothiol synthase [Acidimicrobiales bacterium]|nr:MAG: mycothiol synthase [Actinobacteria bacterium 21-64-8]HQU00192.1 mycothiol synthase [Acidimicrobiales bacterium]